MKYTVDLNDRPVYLQIYKQLRADIVGGAFAYGSKLPSKRLLAEELGVSTITTEHAYDLLCEEGYAQARERSGYFVIFKRSDGFAASGGNFSEPAKEKHLGHSKPVFPVSLLSRTMRKVIADCGEEILERSPHSGRVELREALRQYLARNRGISVDTEQIIVGSGAEYLYGLIVDLLGRDKIYAIESPSYEKIEQVYRANCVSCRLLPLGKDGIESSALSSCIADVLHITPFRSFPSGVTASAAKKREYLRWAEKNDSVIIEDDFESEFTILSKPEDTVFSLDKNQRVIYVNTFSQTIAPAIRIGYMLLPERLVKDFEEKAGFYSCTVPTYEQYVLAEFISSGNFEKHINRVRRKKRKLHFGESEK